MDPSSDVKIPFNRDPPRPGYLHQIIENPIGHLFVKMPFVAVRPKIEFETFELHAAPVRNVADPKRRKIGLGGPGANAGEFRAIKRNLILPIRIRVGERF